MSQREPASFAPIVLMRPGEGKGQFQGHKGSYNSPQWFLILPCIFSFVDLSLFLPRVMASHRTGLLGRTPLPGSHQDFPSIPQPSEPWTLAAVQLSWKQLPGLVPVSFIIRISPLPLESSEFGQALVFFILP